MDEVGRGTGTRDGLAIAWAVCLTILERVRARTLFATHFHELTGLVHPRIANLSMDVLEREGEVIFLKRVRPGPSDNSYGLHVAKLAGLPAETLTWAGEVLDRLVAGAAPGGAPPAAASEPVPVAAYASSAGTAPAVPKPAPTLFPATELVLGEIRALRLDRTTPLEALNRLARWKAELDGEADDGRGGPSGAAAARTGAPRRGPAAEIVLPGRCLCCGAWMFGEPDRPCRSARGAGPDSCPLPNALPGVRDAAARRGGPLHPVPRGGVRLFLVRGGVRLPGHGPRPGDRVQVRRSPPARGPLRPVHRPTARGDPARPPRGPGAGPAGPPRPRRRRAARTGARAPARACGS